MVIVVVTFVAILVKWCLVYNILRFKANSIPVNGLTVNPNNVPYIIYFFYYSTITNTTATEIKKLNKKL